MKEITLPAQKRSWFPPPKWWTTTFKNAWQYRRTCPLKISNCPFRINGVPHKITSPLKKFHDAFSPSMLINNLYWECPAKKVTYSLIIRNNPYQITSYMHKMALPAPKKLIMTFPLPNDEQLRSGMSDNTAWHIPSTYEAFHLELLLFRTK